MKYKSNPKPAAPAKAAPAKAVPVNESSPSLDDPNEMHETMTPKQWHAAMMKRAASAVPPAQMPPTRPNPFAKK